MTNEKQVAMRLVETILAKGYSIIHDYGDTDDKAVFTTETERATIEERLGCSEQDWIDIRDAGYDSRVGVIYLLWGNADDGSELICDHSANPETEEIVREVYTTALEKIENLARPGQELDIHEAIDILCTIYNIARAERRA